MTDADTTRTQLTTYVVQFIGNASRKWVDAAVEPFADETDATAWIYAHIPSNTSRILKRTITDEIVAEMEDVA